jgi:hypothetical protein
LSRFDRQQTEGSNLPVQLGRATEELRGALERHVRAILEAAETRAAEVEREAKSYATKTQHESEARAQQMLETTFARTKRVLDSVELIENALSGMLGALRAELADMAPATLREAPESGPSAEELAPAVEEQRALTEPPSGIRNRAEVGADETESPTKQGEAVEAQRASTEESQAGQVASAPPTGPGGRLQEPHGDASVNPVEPSQEDRAPHKLHTTGELDQSGTPNTAEAQADETQSNGEQGETAGTQGASAGQPQAGQAQPASAPSAATVGRLQELHDDASENPAEPSQEDRAPHRSDITDELDRLIRGRIRQMIQDGKRRAEVERFLTRFQLGKQYLGILDQFYAEPLPEDGPPRSRGFLRRFRRRGR